MPRLIRKLSLHKALRIGYLRNEKKQQKRLKKYGYVLDKELTDNQHVVAYSPFSGKVLFINNGSESNPLNTTQFIKDWRTNIMNVPTGTFGYTQRFQEDKNTYMKAKKKYGEDKKFELVGHSQGAISVNELASGKDQGLTYNGSLVKQKDNPNVTNYRHPNDIVSAFSNPTDMKTLFQQQPNMRTLNPLAAHGVESVRAAPIFI
jgi:hypothetical protein